MVDKGTCYLPKTRSSVLPCPYLSSGHTKEGRLVHSEGEKDPCSHIPEEYQKDKYV